MDDLKKADEAFLKYQEEIKLKSEKFRAAFIDVEPIRQTSRGKPQLEITKPAIPKAPKPKPKPKKRVSTDDPNLSLF